MVVEGPNLEKLLLEPLKDERQHSEAAAKIGGWDQTAQQHH
jgi:hypothetical protein